VFNGFSSNGSLMFSYYVVINFLAKYYWLLWNFKLIYTD